MKRTILICYLKLKHQIQMYCEFMLKPIDCLFGGFSQAPNILISKESWIFGLKFYPSHWHRYIRGVWDVWLEALPQPLASICPGSLECLGAIFPFFLELATTQTPPLREPIKRWPLPRESQDHSQRLFKLPPHRLEQKKMNRKNTFHGKPKKWKKA